MSGSLLTKQIQNLFCLNHGIQFADFFPIIVYVGEKLIFTV